MNLVMESYVFFAGFATQEESGFKIMGPITSSDAQKFKLFNTTELYVRLFSAKNPSSNYRGYILTYQPDGNQFFFFLI